MVHVIPIIPYEYGFIVSSFCSTSLDNVKGEKCLELFMQCVHFLFVIV